eukprot:m.160611 g.160611  ORF g.160611 m.160611 type:complete len:160 (+) comp38776_c0_seq2:109-588(+)
MRLRSFVQTTENLIENGERNENNLEAFKVLQGEVLKFKALELTKQVTTSSVVEPQLKLWSKVVGIDEMMEQILGSVNDLYEYYNGIVEKTSQRRLDLLATLLSFLGFAELISGIYLAYSTSESVTSSDRDPLNIAIPSVFSALLVILAVVFVVRFELLK